MRRHLSGEGASNTILWRCRLDPFCKGLVHSLELVSLWWGSNMRTTIEKRTVRLTSEWWRMMRMTFHFRSDWRLHDSTCYRSTCTHTRVLVLNRMRPIAEVVLPEVFLDLWVEHLSYLHGITLEIEVRMRHWSVQGWIVVEPWVLESDVLPTAFVFNLLNLRIIGDPLLSHKHFFSFTHEFGQVRSKIQRHIHMLSPIFCAYRGICDIIESCWLVRRLCEFKRSIFLSTNNNMSFQHLPLNLFFIQSCIRYLRRLQ